MAENHPEIQVEETNPMKLPKNIRQIGKPADKQKVYIEDYVYTYLHSFLKEKFKEDTLRAAIILGEYYKKDGVTYAYIKGAVSCAFSQLHEDVSKELSQTTRNYFPGWDMLGWYVSSQGVDAHIQSEIKHHYANCETVTPQYLIYEDELERDVQVFAWEQNALQYLSGYYIYYEKNPRMQEFLIMEKGGRPQELPTYQRTPIKDQIPGNSKKETPEAGTAENVAMSKEYKNRVSAGFHDMRELVQDTKVEKRHLTRQEKKQAAKGREKKPQRVVYAACAAVLVVLVALGITQMGNYQNLKQLQETISNTVLPGWNSSEEQEEPSASPEEDMPTAGDAIKDDALDIGVEQAPIADTFNDSNMEEPKDSEITSEEIMSEEADSAETSANATSAQESTTDGPTVETATAPELYTVKKGDSLYSISRAIYENEDMVDAICELNDISNFHLIFEGQTLKLP